mmetsp:Transcript_43310/g.125009  ORF Transcript_43310/g.125009 Transcript_43310/m.125009 type:complete len:238 (+) Transcript_43310:1070-1783(+)
MCCLHLPRHKPRKKDVANHKRDDQWHKLAKDLNLVDRLLTASIAAAGRICPQLLERLDGAQVAEVSSGVVAHHGDHVRDTEIRRILEPASRVHKEAELCHKSLLVHRRNLQPILQLRELRLWRGQCGLGRVEQDRRVHGAALVRVWHGLLDLVEVEGRELRHHHPNILLLELYRVEAWNWHGRWSGCSCRSLRCRLRSLKAHLHVPGSSRHTEHCLAEGRERGSVEECRASWCAPAA